MRNLALALVVVVAAGFTAGAAVGAGNSVPPNTSQRAAVQTAKAPAAAPSARPFADSVKRLHDSYQRHRQQFVAVSDYSGRVRANRLLGFLGFLAFILLTLPKNLRGVRAFYRQMMERSPLSAESGATDDDNRQARKVLFFYLLFLLYQIVQFPLTLGHDNRVQFTTDLAIQTGLLLAVIWTFNGLKRGLHNRWRGDAARQEKMDRCLGEKLDGINIRWRDIRKLAAGVFVAGFAPAALTHLADWLDALTDIGERVFG